MCKRNHRFDAEKLYHDFFLSTHAVNCLTSKFLDVFGNALDDAPEIPPLPEKTGQGAEWVTVNFYEWFKGHMFTASTTAVMGTTVLEMNPNLARDFWVFDENFLKLVYGLPRFLARRGHEARENLIDGATRWLEEAKSKGDINSTEDWDPYFGSRMIREKEKLDIATGLSTRSKAGIKIGFLFGSVAGPISSLLNNYYPYRIRPQY